MRIDAILSPAEIDHLPERGLRETVCVVFDVLRATSSIVTALANGALEIYPVSTIEEALVLRLKWPEAALGGERHGEKIENFDLGNSPAEYSEKPPAQIITTTTNGTVALRACQEAGEVVAGAILNMDALVRRFKARPPRELLLVCAGTFRDLALEDVFAAGMLCHFFAESERTDAAKTCLAVFDAYRGDALGALEASQNGQALKKNGRGEDVKWCARESVYGVLGIMKEGAIRREDV
jgi:2-phosphosulfolactate phosphatase